MSSTRTINRTTGMVVSGGTVCQDSHLTSRLASKKENMKMMKWQQNMIGMALPWIFSHYTAYQKKPSLYSMCTRGVKSPKAISLFCGAGGCSLGFKQAGYSIVYANDKDFAAVETYRKNFPETTCSNEDINELSFQGILKELGVEPGEML